MPKGRERGRLVAISLKQRSVLPGFGITMGVTLLYLGLIVLIPLSAIFLKAALLTLSLIHI